MNITWDRLIDTCKSHLQEYLETHSMCCEEYLEMSWLEWLHIEMVLLRFHHATRLAERRVWPQFEGFEAQFDPEFDPTNAKDAMNKATAAFESYRDDYPQHREQLSAQVALYLAHQTDDSCYPGWNLLDRILATKGFIALAERGWAPSADGSDWHDINLAELLRKLHRGEW